MRILIEGLGAVGARVARQLTESSEVDGLLLAGGSERRRREVAASCGSSAAVALDDSVAADVGVAVLAGPAGTHATSARRHLADGRNVVSVSDDQGDVRALLDLDAEATARGAAVVVGAGFSPGLSCLLAAHAAQDFDEVTEIHVARLGSGGPACARHLTRTLSGEVLDWRDHAWVRRRAGIGRELCWFPDPVGGRDCYRAALADPLLLVAAFADVERVTARLAAGLADRIRSRVPVPARSAPEGTLGALRVEVRGRRAGVPGTVVLGALDRPAVAAGAVAARCAVLSASRRAPVGAHGLAAFEEPSAVLADLAAVGVKAAVFVGPAG